MLLIKNGRVLTMAGRELENGYVLVREKKIAAVGEGNYEGEEPDQTIDAEGGWIIPGLIEAHCHIGISEEKKGFEGEDSNEKNHPITPYLSALHAVNLMDSAFHNAVAAGITSMMVGPGSSNVVGGQFIIIKPYGRNIERVTVLAPAAMKVAFGENPKNCFFEKGMMPSSRMAIAAMLREELYEARHYLERKEEAERRGERFIPEFRRECWIPLLKKQIPLKAHVHRADDIITAIMIAKEFGLNMTLDHCTEGHFVAEEIAKAGFPAIIGPSLSSRNKIEVQFIDFKTAAILHEAGVKVAITTDHPVSRIQYLANCAGFAAREGLGIYEGLKAITTNAAEICGVSHRVGSLEAGKDADIAVFSGNPMEILTKTLYTIIDGKVVYHYKMKDFV